MPAPRTSPVGACPLGNVAIEEALRRTRGVRRRAVMDTVRGTRLASTRSHRGDSLLTFTATSTTKSFQPSSSKTWSTSCSCSSGSRSSSPPRGLLQWEPECMQVSQLKREPPTCLSPANSRESEGAYRSLGNKA